MGERFAELVALAGEARANGSPGGFRFGRGNPDARLFDPEPAAVPVKVRERRVKSRAVCGQCREPFTPKDARYAAFCSRRCAALSRRGADHESGCPVCGSELSGRRVYCSARCGTVAAMRRFRAKNLKRSCP